MKRRILITILLMVSSILTASAQGRIEKPFNDSWSFKKGPFSNNPIKLVDSWDQKWNKVKIPHTWNAKDMQVKHNAFYEGEAYYKKTFFVNSNLKQKRLFLRFEGVGQHAELYINGKFVGNHKGGYSAFAFDISKDVKFGEDNNILLKVDNTARPDIIPINHNLFGVYGGIYRPVTLIITEKINIAVTDNASKGVYISQNKVSSKSAELNIKVKLSNKYKTYQNIVLENVILDAKGKKVTFRKTSTKVSPQGLQEVQQNLTLRRPHLWNGIKDPYLYKVVTKIWQKGNLIDRIENPLGVRKIEVIANKGVYLNGEKYPMYGVCRHQDWWELGSALENKHHAQDLDMIMEMGATTVRFAHYQQSEYLYSKCDSLGLLIWAEIPFVNRVSTKESGNAKSQLRELIRQNYNHPSIYTWGLHNEVYKPHSYTAALTNELHDLAKTEDPGRYTVAVNGYGHMEHPVNLNSDIQGMNRYFGWYEGKIQDMEPWARKLETNYPTTKLILAEYGAEANISHQTEFLGNTINWQGEFYPETYQTKTHEIHWGIIKKHPYILASYIWNMFDFAVPKWKRGGVPARNMKGLVTFNRKLKKDAFYWYKANWSNNPVLYITQRRLKEREKQVTQVTVYSNVGTPSLFLNDKQLPAPEIGTTDKHFIFKDVRLQKGKNILKTISSFQGEKYEDTIEWNFTKEKKVFTIEKENKKAHSGF